jgi:hypothetical protein
MPFPSTPVFPVAHFVLGPWKIENYEKAFVATQTPGNFVRFEKLNGPDFCSPSFVGKLVGIVCRGVL